MSLKVTRLLVVLCLSLVASNASAGKLSSVRSKTSKSKPQRREPAANSNSSSDDDDSSDREERRERKRNRDSSSLSVSLGKLASVRTQTRRERPRRPSSRPTPPRHQNRPPRRRPARSGWTSPGFGIGFGSGFNFDSCAPTIVEEHHYYGSPADFGVPDTWIVTDPVPTLPPVMPAESVVRAQIVEEPIYEPLCEPIACEPDSICEEVTLVEDGWLLDPFQVRFEIDYAGDEADVSRMGFGLLLNATKGLGIDTGARLFRERGADLRDHMWVGDFNVTYEFLATNVIRTRAGIGLNFLSDAYGGDAGLNLTVGSDLFLGPITFTGEADLGTIGDTDLFHGRVSAAFRCSDHLESFVGYDHLDIGGVKFAGLLAGVRFRY